MKIFLIFAVSLISLITGEEPQTDKQPTEISTGREEDNGKGNGHQIQPWMIYRNCEGSEDFSVQSVYVNENLSQLFLENSDGSSGWTSITWRTLFGADKYPIYAPQRSRPDFLGDFTKMDEIPGLKKDGKFKRVSASFVHFPTQEKGYLVMGLNAYEFVHENHFYHPTGNVKPITDFFQAGDQKLLMPEDKLEEVVSVALIKQAKRDYFDRHAIYKIILKTVTKKLVKAYFKLTSEGIVANLKNAPFVPSVEEMQEEDEFDLLEESALYYFREKDKLSMGYQFTKEFAFPIYYNYNPEKNTYKEYPMRTTNGFNEALKTLGDYNIPHWNRYIVPTETWLGCPDQTFCLGHSFDAVFFADNKYYALHRNIIYTLQYITTKPGTGLYSDSLFPLYGVVNAAFTIGSMAFFIRGRSVTYLTDIYDKDSHKVLAIWRVFPEIDNIDDAYSLTAVITLDKEKEVETDEPQPLQLISTGLRKYHKRHERSTETTEEDIPQKMVYVFSSSKGGIVYQYEIESTKPPKFKFVANKTYNEVNAALPMQISLAFTAEGKVVAMVNHFMIVQSALTFFTKVNLHLGFTIYSGSLQTEKIENFTLVDKYFGCYSGNLEKKLTKEFVQKYVEFAGPKPGVKVFAEKKSTGESTEPPESSTVSIDADSNGFSSKDTERVSLTKETLGNPPANDDDEKIQVKDSSTSAHIATASIVIQAVVIILFVQMLL